MKTHFSCCSRVSLSLSILNIMYPGVDLFKFYLEFLNLLGGQIFIFVLFCFFFNCYLFRYYSPFSCLAFGTVVKPLLVWVVVSHKSLKLCSFSSFLFLSPPQTTQLIKLYTNSNHELLICGVLLDHSLNQQLFDVVYYMN